MEQAKIEERVSLNEQRLGSVLAALKSSGARRVLDLGCGEGKLLQVLLRDRQFEEIIGWMFHIGGWKSPKIGCTWIVCRSCSANAFSYCMVP